MKNSAPPARLLDLSRSLRRAGRVATGVDRVELAYLKHLLDDPVPLFGLARTAYGYVLLDRAGLADLSTRIDGDQDWAPADLLSRLPRRRDDGVARAESTFRKLAIARCSPLRLARMLRHYLPERTSYINVGHANLTDRVLGALNRSKAGISVMIHDVIPLEFPEFQRPGSVQVFERKLRRIQNNADLIIYNSADTRLRAETHLSKWGEVPQSVVAHLGVTVPEPDLADLPTGLPPTQPYFVCVGTIEPRKNHAFLLDLWDEMGAEAPVLLICGGRGWNNEAVFDRLDTLTETDRVHEVGGLRDGALAALVKDASGLLLPSHAEGFGLPPAEALALGTRVLCNDLPVLREILGEKVIYVSLADRYLWINTIKRWVRDPSAEQNSEKFVPPEWADHFKIVLRLI